jgi:hypothetical protein
MNTILYRLVISTVDSGASLRCRTRSAICSALFVIPALRRSDGSSVGTAASNRAISIPLMIDECAWGPGGIIEWQKARSPRSQRQFFHHKSHTDCPGNEPVTRTFWHKIPVSLTPSMNNAQWSCVYPAAPAFPARHCFCASSQGNARTLYTKGEQIRDVCPSVHLCDPLFGLKTN